MSHPKKKLVLSIFVASFAIANAENLRAETTAQTASSGNDSGWVEQEELSKPKVRQVQVGRFGSAKVSIQDLGGEPVSSGLEISVELNCGRKKYRSIEPTLRACEFKDAQFDSKSGRLTLTFKVTDTVKGRQECVKDDSFDFSLSTFCRK